MSRAPGPTLPVRSRGPSRPCRVAIIEDHTAILEMMRSAVETIPGTRSSDKPGTSRRAGLCRRERPDLVILDLGFAVGLRAHLPRGAALPLPEGARAHLFRQPAAGDDPGGLASGRPRSGGEDRDARRISGGPPRGRLGTDLFQPVCERGHSDNRQPPAGTTGPASSASPTGRRRCCARLERGSAPSKSPPSSASAGTRSSITAPASRKRPGVRGSARQARYAVQIGLLADSVAGAAEAV